MGKGETLPAEPLLVPKNLRERLSTLTVYVDFAVPATHLEAFKNALRFGRRQIDAGLGVSPEDDEEIGFIVHKLSRSRLSYHAIIEFRRGRKSPYPRVNRQRFAKLIALLDQAARKMRVESWSESVALSRDSVGAVVPKLAALVERSQRPEVPGARVTGLHLEIPAPGEGRPPVRLGLHWTDTTVNVNVTVRGDTIGKLADAFAMGSQLAAAMTSSEDGKNVGTK